MVTCSVIVGSADAGVIVWTPVPGILNVIVSALRFAFASRIACRSEPAPASLVLLTTNVCGAAPVTVVVSV